jgi:iron complex outermembrane receptor protein
MLGVMVRNSPFSEEKRLYNGMQRSGAWRQVSISAAATLALFGAAPASLSRAHAQDGPAPDELTTVSVPAGSLEEGLVALGRQTNLKLVYPSALTTGKKTAGVAGRLAVKGAIEHLLAQTGLGFTITSTGVVQVPALPVRDQALRAQATIPLDTINVEGGSAQGQQAHPFGYGPGSRDRTSNPQQVVAASKTGTKLADIPGSVQTVPHELLYEQGATMLRQSLDNVSGVNFGGQDSKGFYDHFLIRGLNAQIYEDGFSDGDQLGGVSHSLNGVDHIEVVEGPGSALFGSGPPGGTINIVHYKPSSDVHYGASAQAGSFGTVVNNDYVTDPTTLPGLSYRIDGTFSHTDGFRDLAGHDYEILPQLQYRWAGHTTNAAIDIRQINETPDSYGIIYFNGSPLKNVSINGKYSTPFALSQETYIRPTLTDQ